MTILYLLLEQLEETRKHSSTEYTDRNKHIADLSKRPDSNELYIHYSDTFKDTKQQDINKMGFNMNQPYDTPFGVYAYPINNIVGDFKLNAEYGYIFKIANTNNFMTIHKMRPMEYSKNISIIKDKIFDNNNYDYIHVLHNSEGNAPIKTDGGILYKFIQDISQDIKYNKGKKPNVFQTHIWNKLLGYDGIIDNGAGIIHENEPYQTVVFKLSNIKIVDMLRKTKYDTDTLPLALLMGTEDDVDRVLSYGVNPEESYGAVSLGKQLGYTGFDKYKITSNYTIDNALLLAQKHNNPKILYNAVSKKIMPPKSIKSIRPYASAIAKGWDKNILIDIVYGTKIDVLDIKQEIIYSMMYGNTELLELLFGKSTINGNSDLLTRLPKSIPLNYASVDKYVDSINLATANGATWDDEELGKNLIINATNSKIKDVIPNIAQAFVDAGYKFPPSSVKMANKIQDTHLHIKRFVNRHK